MGRSDTYADTSVSAIEGTAAAPERSEPVRRRPLLLLLDDLQQALRIRFENYERATSRPFSLGADGGPGSALRRLQLGVALLGKLEEQLLLPALGEARARPWPALDQAGRDVVALGELSALLDRAAPLQRTVVVATLEGQARLHFHLLSMMLREGDGAGAAVALPH